MSFFCDSLAGCHMQAKESARDLGRILDFEGHDELTRRHLLAALEELETATALIQGRRAEREANTHAS